MSNAAHQGDLVDFESLPRSATVPEAPARQFALDVGRCHRQTSRQPFDDHDEGFAVGLASGQKTQHMVRLTARVLG